MLLDCDEVSQERIFLFIVVLFELNDFFYREFLVKQVLLKRFNLLINMLD
jgi:hypothetical protein